jgi:hypothetical protein
VGQARPVSTAVSLPEALTVSSTLVIACGALVREVRAVLGQTDASIAVEFLPAPLHNRPERIVDAVRTVIAAQAKPPQRVIIAYADCGTGGGLRRASDELAASLGITVTMLPGAHCYEFFSGRDVFAAFHEAEPGTFYLTDFLARQADALIFGALGIDRHPELRDMYFANYRRLVYLAQSDNPELVAVARAVADRLGLCFELHRTGLEPFRAAVHELVGAP